MGSSQTVASEEPATAAAAQAFTNMNHCNYAVKDEERIEGVATDSAIETDSLKNQVSRVYVCMARLARN